MATLKDEAMDYIPLKTKNIADLPEVAVDLEVYEATGVDRDGKSFTYKYVELNGEEYRVPAVVLRDLKTMLEENPGFNKFKVKKTGEGVKTRYTVIPIR